MWDVLSLRKVNSIMQQAWNDRRFDTSMRVTTRIARERRKQLETCDRYCTLAAYIVFPTIKHMNDKLIKFCKITSINSFIFYIGTYLNVGTMGEQSLV